MSEEESSMMEPEGAVDVIEVPAPAASGGAVPSPAADPELDTPTVGPPSTTPSTIGGITALAAFAVAVISGVAAGNSAASVLVRAIIAMLACYPMGMIVGIVAMRVVRENIERHREANPAPYLDDAFEQGGADDGADEGVIVV